MAVSPEPAAPGVDPEPRLPACAWWNLRYLCLGDDVKRQRRIQNLRALCNTHAIVGVCELHDADAAQAQRFVFDHVGGQIVFYDGDLATVVDTTWANSNGITPGTSETDRGPNFHSIIPGVVHAVCWTTPGKRDGQGIVGWFLNFHLDAGSDPTVRIQ